MAEDGTSRPSTAQHQLHQSPTKQMINAPPALRLTDPSTPRRILIPTSRLPANTPRVSSATIAKALQDLNAEQNARSPRLKHTAGKLRTNRTPAVSLSGIDVLANIPTASSAGVGAAHKHSHSQHHLPVHGGDDVFSGDGPGRPSWIRMYLGNFEIVQDSVQLKGFQLYAVEKWSVP